MIEQITERDVEIGLAAATWEEAIEVAAAPLVSDGSVKRSYVDAMIDAVKRVGPYIVLCKGVALAHARPECGVVKPALHFSVFPEGVAFGKEQFDPIKLVITLAAEDDNSHLDLMSELAGILMDQDNIDELVSSADAPEFVEKIKRFAAEA